MKPLKPRDKVTQRMTRDGLTLDNQTTGESSQRVQPGGRAGIYRRAGRRCGKGTGTGRGHPRPPQGETGGQGRRGRGDGGRRSPAPAIFPAAIYRRRTGRPLPAFKYIRKAEKKADKLDAMCRQRRASQKGTRRHDRHKETVYDEASGSLPPKTKLRFDKVEKPAPQLKPNPMSRPVQEAGLFVHGKIHEVEHENVGVEGGHKGEELAERQAGKAIRSGIRRHKLKPYRAAAKAERKSIAANAEYIYQKSLRDNPELAQAVSNPVSRFWQKQKIKRTTPRQRGPQARRHRVRREPPPRRRRPAPQPRKPPRKAKRGRRSLSVTGKGRCSSAAWALCSCWLWAACNPAPPCLAAPGRVWPPRPICPRTTICWGPKPPTRIRSRLTACELDNYESLHPGYDEYRFDLDDIGHDPYVLTSILSALHGGNLYAGEVQGDLDRLFGLQYTLTPDHRNETRYRTETRTDGPSPSGGQPPRRNTSTRWKCRTPITFATWSW